MPAVRRPAGVRWQVHVEPAATTADGGYLPPQTEPVGAVPYPSDGPARTWNSDQQAVQRDVRSPASAAGVTVPAS